jgi:phosphatidate phosphatase APP1
MMIRTRSRGLFSNLLGVVQGWGRARPWKVALLIQLLVVSFSARPEAAERLKADEEIVFFPTLGKRVGNGVEVDLHAWVFEPEKSHVIEPLLRRSLEIKHERFSAEERSLFDRRLQGFLVDNERGKRVEVRIGGHVVSLGRTHADGHVQIRTRVPWPASAEGRGKEAVPNETEDVVLPFQAVLRPNDPRLFNGAVHLLSERGLSVISDLDDTIKISQVNDREALLRNTFLLPFRPVPGMAEVYRDWAQRRGASFHYVSATPWQLYGSVNSFLATNGFPAGTVHLKSFRWKDRTFFNLFASPETYKLKTIDPILKRFPKRKFVLVGDSGERDPEVYGELARRHPGQILRVLIRQTTADGIGPERWTQAFHDLTSGLAVGFREASEIQRRLP